MCVFFFVCVCFALVLYFLLLFLCLFDTVEHARNVFLRCSFVQMFSSFQGLCMPYIFMKLISYAFNGSVLKKFIAQGASMF